MALFNILLKKKRKEMNVMGLPTVPAIPPISTVTAANLLLTSIAFEELGLAHIINAEGEKIQAALGTLNGPPLAGSITDLLNIDASVSRTLRNVIKKEMLLQFKLEDVIDLLREAGAIGGGVVVPCDCTIIALSLSGLGGLVTLTLDGAGNIVLTVAGVSTTISQSLLRCENGVLILSIAGLIEIAIPAVTGTITVTAVLPGLGQVSLTGTISTACA
jgi:hypothetical protein